MKRIKKQPVVKLNLSLERDFYELLQSHAKSDYVRVATWTKQYLKRNLLKNNDDSNCLTNDRSNMEL